MAAMAASAATKKGRRLMRPPPAPQLADLTKAGRNLAPPVDIDLPGAGRVRLLRLLRVLPGRRYVGQAIWHSATGETHTVLAKLLVGAKAARHFPREQTGARLLAEQGVATPALLAADYVEGQGGWLLFEYLEAAQNLAVCSDDAVRAIARLHSKGLWQEDLHPDNLLLLAGRLYFIDGGSVRAEKPGEPLSSTRALENLGLFCAQWPIHADNHLAARWATYQASNPHSAAGGSLGALQAAVERQRRLRLADGLKKIGRECSAFHVRQNGAFGLCVVRREAQEALGALLQDPDAHIAAGHHYKDGGTATVARVNIAGRAVVIKRYNIKHFRHWLTRFWRPSRAWTSWREGNRLLMLGIATAKPLAVLERRWLWLTGVAYLVTEDLPGEDIIARFQDKADHPETIAPEEIAAIWRLFDDLAHARISHGDMKGHNLIWRPEDPGQGPEDNKGHWSLIDLDAMRAHHSQAAFLRAHRRDCARFLQNWPGSALAKLLGERLGNR
jgi:tRNA A-37 threonylcarbamoyl transferase component Bud32